MYNVPLQRLNQHRQDEAEFNRRKEARELDLEIMSHVRFFEDHGDAVARSDYTERISRALTEAYAGIRTKNLRFTLERLRQHIEEEISNERYQGH